MSKSGKTPTHLGQLDNFPDRNSVNLDKFFRASYIAPAETIQGGKNLLETDSGKVFFLTQSAAITLPTPADAGAGWKADFIVSVAPATAPGYFISTSDATGVIHGNVISAGANEGTSGTAITAITFVDGEAGVGDKVSLLSDGTNFYLDGFVSGAAGLTLAE
jgi:hypothetical protein